MGLSSNSGRGDRSAASKLLFHTTDAVGGSNTQLSAEPDGDILPDNEYTC